MSESTYSDLLVLFVTGVGLLVLGGAHLVFRQRPVWRLATGLSVAIVAAVAPMALGQASPALVPALVLGAVALGGAVVALPVIASALQAGSALARRPATGAVALVLAGAGVTVATAVRIDLEEEAVIERDTAWMMEIGAQPLLHPAEGVV